MGLPCFEQGSQQALCRCWSRRRCSARLSRTVGSAVTRVDRATFGISVASAVGSAPLPNRATRLPRVAHELPAPSAPERRTDLGLGGAPAGASSAFVFFLIAASIALVL